MIRQTNTKKFGLELDQQLKHLMMEKNCFIKKIMLELQLMLMIIYLWTNHLLVRCFLCMRNLFVKKTKQKKTGFNLSWHPQFAILLEFIHLNFFLEWPYCFIIKMRFRKTFCPAVLQFVLKSQELRKVTLFGSDYELIKQFISRNLVEISSKRVKY